MKKPFREHHLLQSLIQFEEQNLPLDLFLRHYFKTHSAIGAKDRKEICDHLYTLIRWRGLIDYATSPPLNWESRYRTLKNHSLEELARIPGTPLHVQVSFPKPFYELLVRSLGAERAHLFCQVSNQTAPTTVRVNTLLTSRDSLLETWSSLYPVTPCQHAKTGIRFAEKTHFFSMPEFKQGYFEIQDEASQLIGELVAINPGERCLDYCAGSGGKTLAIAPKMGRKGQLFLHDIRPRALAEAKKRLKRAQVQNAQLLLPDAPQKKLLIGKMDWVLVDAPCSGTGTLRRNPDMKWRFSEEMIPRLVAEQRLIVQEALRYLKPQGRLVYATCSVLPEENELQAAYFTEHFGLEIASEAFVSFPTPGGMDGFFGIVLKKKKL